MPRLEAILVPLVVLSALGSIASQHQARRLYNELEREQSRAQQLEVEWGQLQLEQSTWAALARIERIAHEKMQMTPPATDRVVVIEDKP